MHDHERWTGQLSAYLDHHLAAGDRAAVDGHLRDCADCRAALDDLRRITAAAARYRGAPPSRDLWPDIAEAIAADRVAELPARRRDQRIWWGGPQLMAAGIGIATLAVAATWFALRGTGPGADLASSGSTPAVVQAAARMTPDRAYDQAVADLTGVLAEGRARLDTATVRVIEHNLALIDQAIAEAQAALAADPASVDLQTWVAANQRRKLDLLRRATTAVRLAIES